IDRAHGLIVGPDGAPDTASAALPAPAAAADPDASASAPETVSRAIPRFGRAAAALATILAGVALPLLVAYSMLARGGVRGLGPDDARALPAAGAAIATSIFLFQASAAGEVPALLGALPPLALLAFAARRYRSGT